MVSSKVASASSSSWSSISWNRETGNPRIQFRLPPNRIRPQARVQRPETITTIKLHHHGRPLFRLRHQATAFDGRRNSRGRCRKARETDAPSRPDQGELLLRPTLCCHGGLCTISVRVPLCPSRRLRQPAPLRLLLASSSRPRSTLLLRLGWVSPRRRRPSARMPQPRQRRFHSQAIRPRLLLQCRRRCVSGGVRLGRPPLTSCPASCPPSSLRRSRSHMLQWRQSRSPTMPSPRCAPSDSLSCPLSPLAPCPRFCSRLAR